MDLNFGPEYEEFRQEVLDFCKEYEGVSFVSQRKDDSLSDTLRGSTCWPLSR